MHLHPCYSNDVTQILTGDYKYSKLPERINLHMYMDDIKLFAKNEKIGPFNTNNKKIGMEFGREKCTMLIMSNRKRQITEGIEMPKQERIRTLGGKENYKDFGSWYHQTSEERKQMTKKYFRRSRKLLETKLLRRNLIKGINTEEYLL